MEEKFNNLLQLRFEERNNHMLKALTREKQALNARGLLNSSYTIGVCYEVLKNELVESNKVIVSSAIDIVKNDNLIPNASKIKEICAKALEKRKQEIEGLFLSNIRTIAEDQKNKEMIKPYMSICSFYDLQQEEMNVMVSQECARFISEHGGSLAGLLKARLLSWKIIASAVIVIMVIVAIAQFVDAIDILSKKSGTFLNATGNDSN